MLSAEMKIEIIKLSNPHHFSSIEIKCSLYVFSAGKQVYWRMPNAVECRLKCQPKEQKGE